MPTFTRVGSGGLRCRHLSAPGPVGRGGGVLVILTRPSWWRPLENVGHARPEALDPRGVQTITTNELHPRRWDVR